MVRVLVVVAVLAVMAPLFATSTAGARSELDRARQQAEAVTDQLIDAQRRVDATRLRAEEAMLVAEEANGVAIELQIEIDVLTERADAARQVSERLRSAVADIAVDRYVNGNRGLATLTAPGVSDPYEHARAEQLGQIAVYGTEDAVDQWRAARIDLADAQTALDDRLERQLVVAAEASAAEAEVNADLEALQADLDEVAAAEARWDAEVARLEADERRRVEEQRRAREAELARQLKADREAAALAVAATPAATSRNELTGASGVRPGGSGSSDRESAGSASGGRASGGATTATTSARSLATSAPVPATPPPGSPSTTAAAPGPAPAPTTTSAAATTTTAPPPPPPPSTTAAPPPPPSTGSMLCPIAGATSFTDTWGAPRSGGRSHRGVDMFAARGTPIVAVVSGEVRHSSSSLGGLQFYLYGDNGTRYFGSHLDSSAASGRVSAGTVIGTVGNTGNARWSSPHLHFEIHPGGASAVNPTPATRAACG